MKRFWSLGIIFIFGPLFAPTTQSNTYNSAYPSTIFPSNSGEINYLTDLIYESLLDSTQVPKKSILGKALMGYLQLVEKGVIAEGKPLTVIDFSLASTEDRLWVIDMEKHKVRYQSLVAHGRNSGENIAKNFSNEHSSYMSSLGFYLTGETYQGNHGYSLRLDGLEKGINDEARARAIVIHGADYVNHQFISTNGRLGRSLGCPALPMETHEDIINLIKDKSPIFIYAHSPEYFALSSFLKPLG